MAQFLTATDKFTPFEGNAGQPGPRAENRERGQAEARWKSTIVRPSVPSGENSPRCPNTQLAKAIAQGDNAAKWARQNGVPRRTAQVGP